MHEMMTTKEVADYLRLKERKIYDLVSSGDIPCTRVTGKWLFPRRLIDDWILHNTDFGPGAALPAARPRQIGGSHDPLLEWAARESGSGLGLLCDGSLDGLARLAAGEVMAAGVHLCESEGDYNTAAVREYLPMHPVVSIEWARRRQGLLLAPGNPRGVRNLDDAVNAGLTWVDRQPTSGAHRLLRRVLADNGYDSAGLPVADAIARTETDLALAVQSGEGDVGLGLEAVAHQQGLHFLPLTEERYDLVLFRRDFFEPPWQRLMTFVSDGRFRRRAQGLAGYDISRLGEVHYNAAFG